MLAFIVRRGLQAVLALLAVSLLVFVAVYSLGNPVNVLINPPLDAQQRERANAALGLEQPLGAQFRQFVSGALHGDVGRSYAHDTPALDLILERLPATLELAVVATLMAVVLGLPLGLWAGLKPRTAAARAIMAASLLGISLPTFWIGLVLIMLFSAGLGWLPANGRGPTSLLFGVPVSCLSLDGWRHLILPATTLALFNLALLVRLARTGMRDALRQGYVRFARAKGLSHARVIGVHAMRNIVVPILPVISLQFGSVIAFAILVETVFAWPGMGKLLIDAISVRDRPVIVAYLLVAALLIIGSNLVIDILCCALDPRIRGSEAKR